MNPKDAQVIRTFFQNKRDINYVILFGSAVRTKHLRKESDIDLLVGGELDFKRRVDAALSLEQKIGRKVDIVCTPQSSCEVALEAFAKGLPLVVRNRARLKEDYFKKLYEYEDNIPLMRIRREKVKRDLAHG
jgi:predicted nucleotidyltransferase